MSKKRKFGLKQRLLLVTLLPLIIMIGLSLLALETVGSNVGGKITEKELSIGATSMVDKIDAVCHGDYSYDGKSLKSGPIIISDNKRMLDDDKEKVGIDFTIFVGDVRVSTTILDKDGNRIEGTKMSKKAYEAVLKNGKYFANNVDVNGAVYYGYYEVFGDTWDGDPVIMFTGKDSAIVHALYRRPVLISIGIMVLITVAAAIIVLFIVLSITKSIQKVVGNLKEVADGNLKTKIDAKLLKRSDEVGDIGHAVSELVENLSGIVNNINSCVMAMDDFANGFKTNFTSIDHSIGNVNTAVGEIATGATSLATETQDVTDLMVDMGNVVAHTNSNTEELLQNTDVMKQQNNKASRSFEELIRVNESTSDSMGKVQHQTNLTNESALRIQGAIDLISDIAAQTNLLSLNASIEAARAGEHGRGFAVVAEEVRKLADQSEQSVHEITGIIQTLIDNSNDSVSIMDTVILDMQKQSVKMQDTQVVLRELDENINRVVESVTGISSEVSTVGDAKNSVLGSLESLSAVSQENAASTQETSATMVELSNIVQTCNESVDKLVNLAEQLTDSIAKINL